MIATILRSSTRFNAVEYNEKKVTQGTAELLEIKSFDLLQNTGNVNSSSLQDILSSTLQRMIIFKSHNFILLSLARKMSMTTMN